MACTFAQDGLFCRGEKEGGCVLRSNGLFRHECSVVGEDAPFVSCLGGGLAVFANVGRVVAVIVGGACIPCLRVDCHCQALLECGLLSFGRLCVLVFLLAEHECHVSGDHANGHSCGHAGNETAVPTSPSVVVFASGAACHAACQATGENSYRGNSEVAKRSSNDAATWRRDKWGRPDGWSFRDSLFL